MVGKLLERSEHFEAMFIRHDGEIEPIVDDVLMICSNSIEELIDMCNKHVNVDGTIEIYKKFEHLNNSVFHKAIKVYSSLEPSYI